MLICGLPDEVQNRVCRELSIKDPHCPDAKQYDRVIAFLEEDNQIAESLAMLNKYHLGAGFPYEQNRARHRAARRPDTSLLQIVIDIFAENCALRFTRAVQMTLSICEDVGCVTSGRRMIRLWGSPFATRVGTLVESATEARRGSTTILSLRRKNDHQAARSAGPGAQANPAPKLAVVDRVTQHLPGSYDHARAAARARCVGGGRHHERFRRPHDLLLRN